MFERSGGIGSEGIYDSPTDDRNNNSRQNKLNSKNFVLHKISALQ